MEAKMARSISDGPVLPPELIDMILSFLFTCKTHPWSTLRNPCADWQHTPPRALSLLPLRLVNHHFHAALTPPLFHHLTCKAPRHRHRKLQHFSHKPNLTPLIRFLRVEISPEDLGGRMRRVTQALDVTAEKKLLHYLEVLGMTLPDLLKRYKRVRVLHLTTTYDGVPGKRLPKLEVLPRCFETLCESIRKAELPELEEVILGVPYEGGYTNFFEDLEDKRYERALRRVGKGVRSASVKLFDQGGNFTTMPFF